MMRYFVLVGLLLLAAPAHAQITVDTPAYSGDQLLFFFDARTNRVPFLTVANPADEEITVEVAFYPQDLASRLGEAIVTIPAQGNVVVNPAQEAGGAANGRAGITVVTPMDGETPVIPPQPLMGSYTLANTALQAGFGGNPMGRRGVRATGAFAEPGEAVDGETVRYQRFAPKVLMVPTYYNPATLDPPEDDGNRVVFAAFVDGYRPQFEILPHTVSSVVSLVDANGNTIASRDRAISSVQLSDLQQLAGDTPLDSSGKVFVEVTELELGNLFGIFSQSLAAFGAGARMPAVDEAPAGGPTPTPIPQPTETPGPVVPTAAPPTPSAAPGTCGDGVLDPGEDCDGDNLDGYECEDIVSFAYRCKGTPGCNDQCEFTGGSCECPCDTDYDCDIEVDCSSFVEDCELFGACENGICVIESQGTSEICLGFDIDPDFPDDPEPRCEEF